jgi:E3 ubiquitin-protein ligase HUWE1
MHPRKVIQAIPNAIGALCLNQAGQDQLSGRPSIIPGIFAIFTSERHLKVLQDKENAVLIGTAMDELIRHHPSLKAPVFEAIKSTLSKIEDLGNAYVVPEDIRQWYKLVPVLGSSTDQDVDMEVADSEGAGGAPAADSEQLGSASNDLAGGEDPALRSHDNVVVSFIDIVGRVSKFSVFISDHVSDKISTVAVSGRIIPDYDPLQRFHDNHRWT